MAVTSGSSKLAQVSRDGVVAGILGAATVAVWFVIADAFAGRPLFTPNALGTALFQRIPVGESLTAVPVSAGVIVMFTLVHGTVFLFIGLVTSVLLTVSGHHPGWVFGVLLLFVLEFGFNLAAMAFAKPALRVLPWPSILAANLLAAASMGGYFWLRRWKLSSVSS